MGIYIRCTYQRNYYYVHGQWVPENDMTSLLLSMIGIPTNRVFPENGSLSYRCILGYIDMVDLRIVHWRNRSHDTRCASVSPWITKWWCRGAPSFSEDLCAGLLDVLDELVLPPVGRVVHLRGLLQTIKPTKLTNSVMVWWSIWRLNLKTFWAWNMFPNNMVSNLNYLIRFNNIFAPDPVFVKFCQSSSLKLSYQVWNVVTLSTYRGILPVEVEKGILEHKW